MAEIKMATMTDAMSLAGRLGYGDALEVYAMGLTPWTAIKNCMDNKIEAWTASVGGRVEVFFGVSRTSALSRTPTAFLLGSDTIPRVSFLRTAQATADHWRETYAPLVAFVDIRNLRAQRWLEWIGFERQEIVPAGPNRRPFVKVGLDRKKGELYG